MYAVASTALGARGPEPNVLGQTPGPSAPLPSPFAPAPGLEVIGVGGSGSSRPVGRPGPRRSHGRRRRRAMSGRGSVRRGAQRDFGGGGRFGAAGGGRDRVRLLDRGSRCVRVTCGSARSAGRGGDARGVGRRKDSLSRTRQFPEPHRTGPRPASDPYAPVPHGRIDGRENSRPSSQARL